jgi:iron(III) transport system ATP-binding protein
MGSNNRLPAKVVQRDGAQVRLDVNGTTLQGTARGVGGGEPSTIIRVEEVKISATPVENAIEMPLLTCMYLGDRFECLFKSADGGEFGVRAYSKYKLEAGKYWLQLPADKLWVF